MVHEFTLQHGVPLCIKCPQADSVKKKEEEEALLILVTAYGVLC